MSRRVSVAASVLGLFLVSGLTMALPIANAQSTVMVSIPSGSGAGQSAAPGYSPDTITLVIGVNNTVTWTNNDTAHHTVTSVTGNGSISSGDMAPAATYSYTFTTPGTYQYHCTFHSWMTGTVVVKAGSAPPAGLMISMPSGAGSPNGAPGYSPDTITLVIGVNATVTWVNNDTAHHTVTSVTGNGSISSGDMAPGATFTYTFMTPGTYKYLCIYHSWMTGVVIVKPASAVPEFPAAYLALTLFAAIAAVIVVAPRLRPMLSPGAASGTAKGRFVQKGPSRPQ